MSISINILNIILLIIISIGFYYVYIKSEFFTPIRFNPRYNKVSVASYYNPFYTYIPPTNLDYLIHVPPKYNTNASRSWLANKTFYCSQYNNPNIGSPQEPQECPDSSFTYVDRIGDFVNDSTLDLNYPGCIQLKEGSNYCYSDMFGNYKPNVKVLDHRSA